MKVVVRSSSLLFTLLSIILHAPIRRVKRRIDANTPAHENEPLRVIENSTLPASSPSGEIFAGRGKI